MFEAAGVARTERSIINWCQPNRQGIVRLDSYYDPNERKYYITPQSVESAVQEEIQRAKKSIDASSAESFGSALKTAKHSSDVVTPNAVDGRKVLELEREIRLKGDASDWQRCPYVPENGFGEIAVDQDWHWEKAL